MTPALTRIFHSPSPDATAVLAARLGAQLGKGDAVLLSGPVGAGKSHFARALIQSRLGRQEDVPSPSFTLVQTYDLGGAEIWHADLYRLSDPDEIAELGLEQAFEEAICLVEWPERMGDAAPAGALHLELAPGDGPEDRILTFRANDPRWRRCLDSLDLGDHGAGPGDV